MANKNSKGKNAKYKKDKKKSLKKSTIVVKNSSLENQLKNTKKAKKQSKGKKPKKVAKVPNVDKKTNEKAKFRPTIVSDVLNQEVNFPTNGYIKINHSEITFSSETIEKNLSLAEKQKDSNEQKNRSSKRKKLKK
mmetsp:Transcript_12060/g.18036  ORF Transcript_12060/g.18036 Transcript_12060/m.18036 type:complete len:135 (-) Transcript_12060:18-422(-)